MLQNLDLSSVDIVCTTGQVAEEPYTTENLAWLRGGYKMLTNVTELLRVNFCNPQVNSLMILSFRTDMPGQTVQTQVRLLLEVQSDQGLHCLPFRLHHLDSLLYVRAT